MSFQANWDWLWCPGLSPMLVPTSFPSPYLAVFPFTLLHLPLDFIRLFFTAAVSAPHHQPSMFPLRCTRARTTFFYWLMLSIGHECYCSRGRPTAARLGHRIKINLKSVQRLTGQKIFLALYNVLKIDINLFFYPS